MVTTVENYIGVMSGSSLDGLDIAMVSFTLDVRGDITSWRVEKSTTVAFDDKMIERLRSFYHLSAIDYFQLESDFSKWVGEQVYAFANDHKVMAIGFHGHTLTHRPEDDVSIQMGNGGIMASITQIDTITDFRIQDIIKRGTGAPIVPTVEMALFPGYDYYLNLGGIANMTIMSHKTAYDICPCNQVLNHLAKKLGHPYDDQGTMARKGKIDHQVIDKINRLSYFQQSPPKSIDNQWIKSEVIPLFESMDAHNGLATSVEMMTTMIAEATDRSGKMLITGGGAKNTYLIEILTEKLKSKNIEVILPENKIIDGKEAILMAYMAYARIHHKKNVFRAFTGAISDTIAGAHYKN